MCHDYFQKNPGKIITKFNFNELFSQAWLKSLVPANLIAGFKTCGIYPLNRKALRAVPTCNSGGSEEEVVDKPAGTSNKRSENPSDHINNNQSTTTESSAQSKEIYDKGENVLSPELEALYNRRYEEGYNLTIDPGYNQWLKNNHPELLTDESSHSAAGCTEPVQIDAVVDTNSDYFDPTFATSSDFLEYGSILQEFSDVRPLSPVSVESTTEPAGIPNTISGVSTSETPVRTSDTISGEATSETPARIPDTISRDCESTSETPETISGESTSETPARIPETNNVTPASNCDNPHVDSSSTSSVNNCSSSISSPLSQLLADHTPQVTPVATAKRPKARLLTSADCIRMLEEKEAKKKQEAEEKEQKRKEQEEKKKQKEEEGKRKAEEKAKSSKES